MRSIKGWIAILGPLLALLGIVCMPLSAGAGKPSKLVLNDSTSCGTPSIDYTWKGIVKLKPADNGNGNVIEITTNSILFGDQSCEDYDLETRAPGDTSGINFTCNGQQLCLKVPGLGKGTGTWGSLFDGVAEVELCCGVCPTP